MLAEASLILPVVFIAVLTVIWLLTAFYEQTAVRSGVHLGLRSTAGIATGTVLPPEEAGFSELYASLFQTEKTKELLRAQADLKISGAASARRGLTFEAEYKGTSLVPVLKMQFNKQKPGWGFYGKGLETENYCWYYSIDEAQWVRNEQWIRSEVKK